MTTLQLIFAPPSTFHRWLAPLL